MDLCGHCPLKQSLACSSALRCSRKRGVSENTGDRAIPICPPPCFPLSHLAPFPHPSHGQLEVPSLCSGFLSRQTALLSSALRCHVTFTETFRGRVLCALPKRGLASPLPGSELVTPTLPPCVCHSVARKTAGTPCQFQASGHSRDRGWGRYRLLTDWVWGVVPTGKYDVCVYLLVNEDTCLPISARDTWKC